MATCSPSTAIDALATLTLKEEGRDGAPALTSSVVQSGEAVVQLWRLVMGMVEEDTVMPSAEQLVQILQPSEAHDRSNFQVGISTALRVVKSECHDKSEASLATFGAEDSPEWLHAGHSRVLIVQRGRVVAPL